MRNKLWHGMHTYCLAPLGLVLTQMAATLLLSVLVVVAAEHQARLLMMVVGVANIVHQ